jgi:hypothetical protein
MCWPEPVRLMHVAQCRRGSAFKDSIESKDPSLINNRQAGRRNRGRNNGRPNGNNRNNGENGNRIDNRARGNAPQLLEKYRNLARDAQLAGDRVNTEYYLQFADHYFRVIADNRARQEEQQARYRRPEDSYEEEGERGYPSYDDGAFAPTEADRHQASQSRAERDEGFAANDADGAEPEQQQERPRRDQREQRQPRAAREPRFARNEQREPREREPREDRPRRAEARQETAAREEQPQPEAPAEAQAEAPRARRGRPRREREDTAEAPGLDLAVLPPSISRADNDTAPEAAPAPAAEDAPAPKRRGRPRKAVAEAAE